MRILLIYLFIAFASSETNNYFYDIVFDERYEIDVSKFPSAFIPKANLYFTVPVENKKEIHFFQVRLLKSDKIDFKVNVSGFTQHPTDSEIVNGTDNIKLEQSSVSTEYDYVIYTFNVPTLKKQDKIKYYGFTVLNNANLSYLSLYAYTFEKIEFIIYNINYMKEEILNKTTLGRYIGAFAFILEIEGQEKNKLIRLKIKKEYSPEIQMVAGGFKERPTKQEELENGNFF
jgi:hypothetical protein